MKYIALLTLSLLSTQVFSQSICQENSIVINGFSKHFAEKTRYAKQNGYNETNYGIGYKCRLDDWNGLTKEVEVGYLKNSYRTDSYYISYNMLKPISENFSIGLKASVNSGYEILNKPNGLIAGVIPTMQYKITNKLATNLTLAPNFLFLNFQRSF